MKHRTRVSSILPASCKEIVFTGTEFRASFCFFWPGIGFGRRNASIAVTHRHWELFYSLWYLVYNLGFWGGHMGLEKHKGRGERKFWLAF
jgi:hypothetical protein